MALRCNPLLRRPSTFADSPGFTLRLWVPLGASPTPTPASGYRARSVTQFWHSFARRRAATVCPLPHLHAPCGPQRVRRGTRNQENGLVVICETRTFCGCSTARPRPSQRAARASSGSGARPEAVKRVGKRRLRETHERGASLEAGSKTSRTWTGGELPQTHACGHHRRPAAQNTPIIPSMSILFRIPFAIMHMSQTLLPRVSFSTP